VRSEEGPQGSPVLEALVLLVRLSFSRARHLSPEAGVPGFPFWRYRMGRLFGTDGVRGRANADLTPELALSVAVAAAHTLAEQDLGRTPVAVVGRDPRASGEMLEAAVVAGLASAGATVIRLGVLPTPGVAYLVGEVQADLGVMISAS